MFTISSKFDQTIRQIVIVLLIGWLLFYGLIYNKEYPDKLVALYHEPWWKLLLVGLVILSAFWSPLVSALLAFTVLLYFSDMDTLTQ
jgi:fumarate reductase subunit D